MHEVLLLQLLVLLVAVHAIAITVLHERLRAILLLLWLLPGAAAVAATPSSGIKRGGRKGRGSHAGQLCLLQTRPGEWEVIHLMKHEYIPGCWCKLAYTDTHNGSNQSSGLNTCEIMHFFPSLCQI